MTALVRSRSLETVLPTIVRQVRGQLPNGDVLISSGGEFSDQGDRTPLIQPTAEIFRVDGGGTARRVLSVPGIQITSVTARFMGRDVVMTDFVRYGSQPRIAMQDSFIVAVTGSAYRLAFHDAEGRPVRTISVAIPRRPMTPAIRAATVAAELEAFRRLVRESPADRGAYERLIEGAPYADSLSAIESIHVAPDKTLWVVEAITPADTTWRAIAFDAGGRILGTLTGPETSRPFAFGTDAVLLRHIDSDGDTWLELRSVVGRRGTR